MLQIVVCQAGSVGPVQVMRLMHPNIDVVHMAGYLRHHMTDVKIDIIDGYAIGVDETVAELDRLLPDILFVHGDTPTATAIYLIINRFKANNRRLGNRSFVGILGEHVSALPDEAFVRSECDFVLLGDAELPALSLCKIFVDQRESMLNPTDVPNILFRHADGHVVRTIRNSAVLDLDALPEAARDLIDLKAYPGAFYKVGSHETSILAARGCPWQCTYCAPAWYRAQQKPRFRVRSPKSLVDEIERLQRDYGIDDFMLDITTFNFSSKWPTHVCEEIIDRGLKVNLKTHLRADNIDPDMLILMRRAGFWLIYLGIESANDRTLLGVKKKVTVAQIEHALTELQAARILVVAELMNFLFWEEDGQLRTEGWRDAMHTLSFARKMYRQGKLKAMYWAPMTPVPASESYAVALRHNLIPEDIKGKWEFWFPVQRPIASLPGVPNFIWFAVQWAGKIQQTYFILRSQILHPSTRALVGRRFLQMINSTMSALYRGLKPSHPA